MKIASDHNSATKLASETAEVCDSLSDWEIRSVQSLSRDKPRIRSKAIKTENKTEKYVKQNDRLMKQHRVMRLISAAHP
jgi:hypothetical protein